MYYPLSGRPLKWTVLCPPTRSLSIEWFKHNRPLSDSLGSLLQTSPGQDFLSGLLGSKCCFNLLFQSWIFRLQFCFNFKRLVSMVPIWSSEIGQFYHRGTLQGIKNPSCHDYGTNYLENEKFCIWLDNSCFTMCRFGYVYGFQRYQDRQ